MCSCNKDGYVFNTNGYCVACRVLGCSKCQIDDPNVCEECGESMNAEENGTCGCSETDHKINTEGECELCSVLGCSSCKANSTN